MAFNDTFKASYLNEPQKPENILSCYSGLELPHCYDFYNFYVV